MGFTIVSTFRRLEYLLWGGMCIYTEHRSLAVVAVRAVVVIVSSAPDETMPSKDATW